MVTLLDQSERTEEQICLIDGDSLLYYEMDKPTLEEALRGLDSRVGTILENCKSNVFVGFLTGRDGYRYNVSSSYKANRKFRPKPIIFYALREYLKQHWKFEEFAGLEADDLVSYYHNTDDRKTIICSPDKDVLFQCVGTHFNYQKVEFVTTTKEEAEKFLWKQVLMGDSTDNITGIPGVGIKTAENWLINRENDFASFVMGQYDKKFGAVEGVHQFCTNFRLVYLMKDDSDIDRELTSLPPLLKPYTLIDDEPVNPTPTEPEQPTWESW